MKTLNPKSNVFRMLQQEDKGNISFYLLESGHYYYIAHRYSYDFMAIVDAEIPNECLWLAYKVYDMCYMQIGDPNHIIKLSMILRDESDKQS